MIPLPKLRNLILPVDGLSREALQASSLQFYKENKWKLGLSNLLQEYVHAKLADVCGTPPLDIGHYGAEFREIKKAVETTLAEAKAKGTFMQKQRLHTKALRDGMQILM